MMRRRLKYVFAFLILAALAGAGYSGLWFWWAGRIEAQIAHWHDSIAHQGTVVDGAFAPVTGFPGAPVTGFSGSLRAPTQALHVPRLVVRGFFLPGTALHIDMPDGVRLEAPEFDSYTSALDAVELAVTVPSPLPAAFTARDLYRWKEAGGSVTLNRLHVRKDTLVVDGEGELTLDERLQPFLRLPARVTGYNAFLLALQQRRLIDTKQALLAGAVINALARPGPDGETMLAADITVQKSTLYLGPVRLVDLPPLIWPE